MIWQNYKFSDDKSQYRKLKFKSIAMSVYLVTGYFRKIVAKRPVVKIFYATESGTAKRFADNLRQFFNVSFNVTLLSIST